MLRFIKGRLVNGKQGTSDYTVQSLVDAFQAEFAYFRFPPSVCIVALAVTAARKVVIKWLNPTVSH